MPDMDGFGPEDLSEYCHVSRETSEALAHYVTLIERWRGRINLMGPREYTTIWRRHVLDSLQIAEHLPGEGDLIDLGSGAGFPALVLAIAQGESAPTVHMVESVGKKCAFLRQVSRELGLRTKTHHARIEAVKVENIGCVTARALASLDQLLTYSEKWTQNGAICLFPKGQIWQEELTLAEKYWRFHSQVIPSLSDPSGVILKLSEISRVSP